MKSKKVNVTSLPNLELTAEWWAQLSSGILAA
jgi:hypothetical protein